MTATALLAEAGQLGVELSATADGKLRWRCRGELSEDLRQRIATHKTELLALLRGARPPAATQPAAEPPEPWDRAIADGLVDGIQARRRQLWGRPASPADPAARRRLLDWMDAFDAACLARDLAALRRLVTEFPAGPGPAITPAEEEAVLRVMERDQGLPEGGLAFFAVALPAEGRATQGRATNRGAAHGTEANLPFPDAADAG
jgi:hypothetical protein